MFIDNTTNSSVIVNDINNKRIPIIETRIIDHKIYHLVYEDSDSEISIREQNAHEPPYSPNGKMAGYVSIKDGHFKGVAYYEKNTMSDSNLPNKSYRKFKVTNIDHTHPIDGVDIKPHTHLGFIHFENGTRNVTSQEQKDINKLEAIWNGLKI